MDFCDFLFGWMVYTSEEYIKLIIMHVHFFFILIM